MVPSMIRWMLPFPLCLLLVSASLAQTTRTTHWQLGPVTTDIIGESAKFANPVANTDGTMSFDVVITTMPLPPPPSGCSPDGTVIRYPTAATVKTNVGKDVWGWGTGSNAVLLNGSQARGGFATLLEVADGCKLFSQNAGVWYTWSDTTSSWFSSTGP